MDEVFDLECFAGAGAEAEAAGVSVKWICLRGAMLRVAVVHVLFHGGGKVLGCWQSDLASGNSFPFAMSGLSRGSKQITMMPMSRYFSSNVLFTQTRKEELDETDKPALPLVPLPTSLRPHSFLSNLVTQASSAHGIASLYPTLAAGLNIPFGVYPTSIKGFAGWERCPSI